MASPGATDLLDQLLRVTLLLGDDLDADLARHGLTPTRMHLLWQLHGSGPSAQQPLAAALGVSPRHVTGLVDDLAETGLVQRRPHPDDRRAVQVSLTRRGSRLVGDQVRRHAELADQLFGDLSPTGRGQAGSLLGRLGDRLTALVEGEQA